MLGQHFSTSRNICSSHVPPLHAARIYAQNMLGQHLFCRANKIYAWPIFLDFMDYMLPPGFKVPDREEQAMKQGALLPTSSISFRSRVGTPMANLEISSIGVGWPNSFLRSWTSCHNTKCHWRSTFAPCTIGIGSSTRRTHKSDASFPPMLSEIPRIQYLRHCCVQSAAPGLVVRLPLPKPQTRHRSRWKSASQSPAVNLITRTVYNCCPSWSVISEALCTNFFNQGVRSSGHTLLPKPMTCSAAQLRGLCFSRCSQTPPSLLPGLENVKLNMWCLWAGTAL